MINGIKFLFLKNKPAVFFKARVIAAGLYALAIILAVGLVITAHPKQDFISIKYEVQ